MADEDDEQTVTVRATIGEMARAFADLLKHPDSDVRRAAELSLSEQFLRTDDKAGEPRRLVAAMLNRAGELAGAGITLASVAMRAREHAGRLGLDAGVLGNELLADAIRASIPNAPGVPTTGASGGRAERVHAVLAALGIASGGVEATAKFLDQHAPLDHEAVPRLTEMLGLPNRK